MGVFSKLKNTKNGVSTIETKTRLIENACNYFVKSYQSWQFKRWFKNKTLLKFHSLPTLYQRVHLYLMNTEIKRFDNPCLFLSEYLLIVIPWSIGPSHFLFLNADAKNTNIFVFHIIKILTELQNKTPIYWTWAEKHFVVVIEWYSTNYTYE